MSDAQTCGEMRIVRVGRNPLRRSCVSDARTCGKTRFLGGWAEMKAEGEQLISCNFNCPAQPSAEIVRVGRTNVW